MSTNLAADPCAEPCLRASVMLRDRRHGLEVHVSDEIGAEVVDEGPSSYG